VSIDRAKALQSAQKYLAKGQLDRAIGEYERLVQADPKDARMLLKLGDLYTRQGANKDASATYRKVAEQYAEQGFFLKAVAVCKQILKLDPTQLDVWERLAEMYEMLSLVSDAMATYEQVADAQMRANNPRKAIKALQKIADLDSENVAARIRYAEALSKLNKPEEAAEAFRLGAELLKQQGRFDDYLKVGERLLFHQPDNYAVARELASIYLERGDAKHSLAKLQACFNADPKDLDTLLLLARAFEQLGQTQKTISVLKEVSRLHANDARRAEQGSVLRRILALDPGDGDARRELSQLGRLPNAPLPAASPARRDESSANIEVEDEDYDLVLEDDEDEVATSQLGSGARPGPGAAEDDQAKIRRLMDECAVFVRYGLTDKIIAQLREVLSVDPRHVDAREKLKDAYIRAKRPVEAAKHAVALADVLASSDPSRAERFLEEAARLDPKNPNLKARLGSRSAARPAQRDDDEFAFSEESATNDVAHGRSAQTDFGSGRPEESFASVMPAMQDELEEPDLVVDEGSMVERLDDDAVMIEAGDEEEADADDVFIVEDSAVAELPDPSDALPTDRPAAAPFEELADEELPEALADAVEEIEFYLKQGLSDEAEEMLTDALASFPEHPVLLRYRRQLSPEAEIEAEAGFELEAGIETEAEIEAEAEIAHAHGDEDPHEHEQEPEYEYEAEPEEAPLAAAPDRSFELAQKLALEEAPAVSSGAGPLNMADVLAQFKQGVARQVDKKDSATHHDLGIAYMEMGLQGEAIEEFKLCLDDPARACTAHTMIGLAYVAKGDMELGIDHFKHALESSPKPEEEVGLWFEMGNAFELLGKNMEALVWYEKVEERDPRFRDVGLRLERLGTARTPEQEADEFDEMFDNMILKE
jgi:tetratricopeptide (TPR) repeat protein